MISQIQDFLQHFKLLNYTRKGIWLTLGNVQENWKRNMSETSWKEPGEKNKAALAHTRFFRTAACSHAREMLFLYNDLAALWIKGSLLPQSNIYKFTPWDAT